MNFSDFENSMIKNWYTEDSIKAVDAKFEAQRIAFAPLTFEAARCLRDLGILRVIDEAGQDGITGAEIISACKTSDYAASVLIEMGLSMNLLKIVPESYPPRLLLGKTGWFILHDRMTRTNVDFVHDVCYAGGFFLKEALAKAEPAGLKVFGAWHTIYQALASLPPQVQKSWFAFDHYYSDGTFPDVLDIVFKKPKIHLMDIGGNTAEWALACWWFNPDVKITIVDLPGQANMAKEAVGQARAQNRIFIFEADVLDPSTCLPPGADAVWMSQFLDCFSLPEITAILLKVAAAVDELCDVFVLEPLWDKQRYPAATFALHATSLYFTTMANGNSKMYNSGELIQAAIAAGFILMEEFHRIGPNDYSILRFRKKP